MSTETIALQSENSFPIAAKIHHLITTWENLVESGWDAGVLQYLYTFVNDFRREMRALYYQEVSDELDCLGVILNELSIHRSAPTGAQYAFATMSLARLNSCK